MNGGIASEAAGTTGNGTSTPTTLSRSTPTRTTGGYLRGISSSRTSPAIPVDLSGWPIVEVQRAVWKWPLCEHCHQRQSKTLVPLDNFGPIWWQDVEPGHRAIHLCQKCYLQARSKFGRIMRYTMVKGKIKQHVDTELFGGDLY